MKITKNKLKQLIKEELNLIQEFELPNILPQEQGIDAIMANVRKALQALVIQDFEEALFLLGNVVEDLSAIVERGEKPGRSPWRR